MPESFDLYRNWQQPTNPGDPLTVFQQRLIVAAFPGRVEILKASPARSWEVYPLRIQVATADGRQTVFLRKDRKTDGLELEAALLPVLSTLGLPVPLKAHRHRKPPQSAHPSDPCSLEAIKKSPNQAET